MAYPAPMTEQRLEKQRARVEHDREIDEHVAEQEEDRDAGAQVFRSILPLEQLRRGRAIVAIIDRQEDVAEHQQACDRRQLPPGKQEHLVAVHPDKLVRRKVGERDRPRHERPAQVSAGKEELSVGVGRPPAHATHLPGRGERHRNREADEHGPLNRIVFQASSLRIPVDGGHYSTRRQYASGPPTRPCSPY
jgi:hypothetical protein